MKNFDADRVRNTVERELTRLENDPSIDILEVKKIIIADIDKSMEKLILEKSVFKLFESHFAGFQTVVSPSKNYWLCLAIKGLYKCEPIIKLLKERYTDKEGICHYDMAMAYFEDYFKKVKDIYDTYELIRKDTDILKDPNHWLTQKYYLACEKTPAYFDLVFDILDCILENTTLAEMTITNQSARIYRMEYMMMSDTQLQKEHKNIMSDKENKREGK